MMHYEDDNQGGSFLLGLLTGAVLGAAIGMLFAPRAGHETRRKMGESAQKFQKTAQDRYSQASHTMHDVVERGKETYDRARHSVQRGVDEARRYASQAAGDARSYASSATEQVKSYTNQAAERAKDAVDTARGYVNDTAENANTSVRDVSSRAERM